MHEEPNTFLAKQSTDSDPRHNRIDWENGRWIETPSGLSWQTSTHQIDDADVGRPAAKVCDDFASY